jgi:hypothetical protein
LDGTRTLLESEAITSVLLAGGTATGFLWEYTLLELLPYANLVSVVKAVDTANECNDANNEVVLDLTGLCE